MRPCCSRSDNYFTHDVISFNTTVYNKTRSYWTEDLIDIQMVANARLARMLESVKYNPEFALSELAGEFSAGEGAGYMLVFGNKTAKTARRDVVEYFFGTFPLFVFHLSSTNRRMKIENERLPTELGWTIPATVITTEDLFEFSNDIINATSYEALNSQP